MSRTILLRKLLLISFLAFFSFSSIAQVQLLLDPLNAFQQSSMFNLSVINQSSVSGTLHLEATLSSRRGKALLIQELYQDLGANESKGIRGQQQVVNKYIDPEFSKMYTGATLPPFDYVLCVKAVLNGDVSSTVNECVEYLASDQLNISAVYPSEEGSISEPRPLFSWINLNQNAAYSYNFRLVQLEEGRRPAVALRRNIPIISKDHLTTSQLLYPSDALPLENGRSYAWQLGINFQGEQVSQSPPYSFSYVENKEYIEIPRDLSYVDITEIEQGATLYAVGEFKFKLPSNTRSTIEASLYELKKTKKKEIGLQEKSFTVGLGVNKFELDLKEQVYLKHLKEYSLNLTDTQSKRSYHFVIKYVNPDYIK